MSEEFVDVLTFSLLLVCSGEGKQNNPTFILSKFLSARQKRRKVTLLLKIIQDCIERRKKSCEQRGGRNMSQERKSPAQIKRMLQREPHSCVAFSWFMALFGWRDPVPETLWSQRTVYFFFPFVEELPFYVRMKEKLERTIETIILSI